MKYFLNYGISQQLPFIWNLTISFVHCIKFSQSEHQQEFFAIFCSQICWGWLYAVLEVCRCFQYSPNFHKEKVLLIIGCLLIASLTNSRCISYDDALHLLAVESERSFTAVIGYHSCHTNNICRIFSWQSVYIII